MYEEVISLSIDFILIYKLALSLEQVFKYIFNYKSMHELKWSRKSDNLQSQKLRNILGVLMKPSL